MTPRDLTPSAAVGGEGADIANALRALCNGHPHAKIAWPHRELHEIADRIEALQPSSAADAKPVAWRYELAYAICEDGSYTNWQRPVVRLTEPHVPTGSIRNLTPLYAQPQPSQQDCFECCAPLVGPFCPECNPAIKQAPGFPVEAANGSGWLASDADDTWWNGVIGKGESHVPSGEIRSIKHMHPAMVKPIYEAHKGTAVADVIAGLIFDLSITRNREQFLVDDANERRIAAEERADQLENQLAASPPLAEGQDGKGAV